MELDITPEPTPDERRAIELALADEPDAGRDARPARSAWQEQGVRENTAADDPD